MAVHPPVFFLKRAFHYLLLFICPRGRSDYFMFYDLFFDKEFATVNRLIKDSHPYSIVKGEGKDTIIINALGVAQEDIKVEIKPVDDRAYLYIQGETKNSITNTKYSFSNRFSINKIKVKEINYSSENGLLYVDVIYKEEPTIEIPITQR
jgi:HSP20 family molecular chaperone IbpA